MYWHQHIQLSALEIRLYRRGHCEIMDVQKHGWRYKTLTIKFNGFIQTECLWKERSHSKLNITADNLHLLLFGASLSEQTPKHWREDQFHVYFSLLSIKLQSFSKSLSSLFCEIVFSFPIVSATYGLNTSPDVGNPFVRTKCARTLFPIFILFNHIKRFWSKEFKTKF